MKIKSWVLALVVVVAFGTRCVVMGQNQQTNHQTDSQSSFIRLGAPGQSFFGVPTVQLPDGSSWPPVLAGLFAAAAALGLGILGLKFVVLMIRSGIGGSSASGDEGENGD
jgi:hypothetical protein